MDKMQEDVTIVLNEREESKARVADALASRLKERNITSSRIEADSKLVEVLHERSPRIVIVDYLIGDLTTGLDILESFNQKGIQSKPHFIFLTDEQSVPVAVQAMQLGATNYLQIDNPGSLDYAIQDIEKILQVSEQPRPASTGSQQSLDSLVAQSPAMLSLINRAKAISLDPNPFVIIYGPHGSGRGTLASGIFNERKPGSFYREIELDLCEASVETVTGYGRNPESSLVLGTNLSLCIRNAEADIGDVLDFISARQKEFWPALGTPSIKQNISFLTVTTTDEQVARAWSRLTGAQLLTVTPLHERTEDISPLIQHFLREASELSGTKIKPFEPETILWLSKQPWEGDAEQLRSVVIEAALIGSFSEESPRELIEKNMEINRVEQCESESNTRIPLSPLLVASVLEQSQFNFRIAAAKLGCSIQQLRTLMNSNEA